MTTLIVDANVAMKWCVPGKTESLVAQARELLESYLSGKIEFLVPDLFWAELGNGLWKSIRRGKTTAQDAAHGLQLVRTLQLPTVSSVLILSQAMDIAVRYGRSVYDSLYVALAVQSDCELVTADEKLANALAAYLPVKWLGAV